MSDRNAVLVGLLVCGALVLFASGGTLFAPLASAPSTPTRPAPAPTPAPAPIPSDRTLRVYTTSGCAPCSALKKSLADPEARNALDAGGWQVREITSKAAADAARVTSYPTTVATVGEQEVDRRTGSMTPRALASWVRSLAPMRQGVIGAVVNGPKHADGTEISADLPGELHQKNIGSPPPNGPGCCVFRSLDHSARWQNVPQLVNFPEWMVKSGVRGGGWPGKVDELIPRISKDRNLPVPTYIQVENADHEILKLACKTGRMVCTTYSKSPTGRYGGSRIAHMVNVVHADDQWVVVLDNNYIGEAAYEWMTPAEARKAGIYEWIVVLLAPPPPPPPISPAGPAPKETAYARRNEP